MDSSSSLPASTFEKSRMSLMIVEQGVARAADALGVLPLALVEVGVQEQAGETDDAVHRGPDLVAHGGHERRLRPRGLECGVAGLLELDAGRWRSDCSSRPVRMSARARTSTMPTNSWPAVGRRWPRRSAISSSAGGTRRGRTAISSCPTYPRLWRLGRRARPTGGVQRRQVEWAMRAVAQHPPQVHQGSCGPVVGKQEVADVRREPAADADGEPDVDRLATSRAGENAQHEGKDDGVGHGIGRPDSAHERLACSGRRRCR